MLRGPSTAWRVIRQVPVARTYAVDRMADCTRNDCQYWEAGWKSVKAFSPPTPMVHPGCAAILERRYDLVRPKPAVKATLHVRTIRSCIPRPFCARSCGLHLSEHHDVSSRAKGDQQVAR